MNTIIVFAASLLLQSGEYVEATYPPSTQPGELQFGVTYTLWLPPGAARIRGIVVHQHGCGSGACKAGATAATDLHWKALAKKWDCALLGPSYRQEDKQDCRLWCDPRNGSEKAFLKALADLAKKSGRPELETAPWCLWGHSGGGTWASIMHVRHPQRIIAIWLRSGTAFSSILENEPPLPPEVAARVHGVPVMCNPGAKENGDKRFNGAWTGTMGMFKSYRAKGAPIGFAPDPRTSHECGDSRYLAIPYFDACLEMRLPERGGSDLKPVDPKSAWLAAPLSDTAVAATAYAGTTEEAVWLPNERVAKAWMEYVKTGAVGDATPPPAATNVKAAVLREGIVTLTWAAEADLESGIKAFIIQQDGKDLLQVPEKPVGRFGRPLFQSMSYHDTPDKVLDGMTIEIPQGAPGKREYRVIVVNSVDLKSEPSKPAVLP